MRGGEKWGFVDKKIVLRDSSHDPELDEINQRYRSSTLQLGTLNKEKVGTKVAFTRIPEKEEFSE